jgi:hypothetical protein
MWVMSAGCPRKVIVIREHTAGEPPAGRARIFIRCPFVRLLEPGRHPDQVGVIQLLAAAVRPAPGPEPARVVAQPKEAVSTIRSTQS